LKGFFKGVRVVVSVARLDPIKGLEQGLLAFGDFLEVVKARTPPDNVLPCFISVVVPSRETVPAYVALKKRVDGLASSINAKYGGLGRPPPISVLYRSISHGELCSLLALGDACMIPSLRDGLNLVASEYIAVQEGVRIKGMRVPGALILSDFTGAASSLSGSLLVNPHDRVSVVAALEAALFSMQPVETESRHSRNASFVLHNTSEYWAKRCLEGLSQQEWTGTTTTATTTTTTGDSGGR
jgi:trehalose 6-phosphate synthase